MNASLERITVDIEVCHGKPCVKGTRRRLHDLQPPAASARSTARGSRRMTSR